LFREGTTGARRLVGARPVEQTRAREVQLKNFYSVGWVRGAFVPVGGLLSRGEGVALANPVWFWRNDFYRASFSIKNPGPENCRTRDRKDPGIYCNIPGKKFRLQTESFQKKIDRPGLQKKPVAPLPFIAAPQKNRSDRSNPIDGRGGLFFSISRPVFRVEVQTVPGDRTDRFYNRSVRPISYSHRTDPLPPHLLKVAPFFICCSLKKTGRTDRSLRSIGATSCIWTYSLRGVSFGDFPEVLFFICGA